MRANNYDARDGTPRWGAAAEAQRLGARAEGPADVLLPDGTPAWCDGGPRTAGLDVDAPVVHRFAIESGQLRVDLDPHESTAASGLAPDQRAAVLHAGGPARILAPAGSGKTTVLTARFRHLVVERGYGAASVCALAYNRRAGAEMQDRLADLPRDAQRKVRTLNSFGYEIVRRRPPQRARDRRTRDPQPHRAAPHAAVPRQHRRAAALPRSARGGAARAALPRARRAATRRRRRLRGDVPAATATASPRRRRSTSTGRSRPRSRRCCGSPACAAVQRECRHLLVDEFQDLRPAHLLLVRLLAAPAYDVFGVGDDDQVIYGYAGADPDFLINFARYFPGAADHPLEVNYRCPPPVVDGARMLLAHNRRRVDKVMRRSRGLRRVMPNAAGRAARRRRRSRRARRT